MLNKVMLIGRLGADPEVRQTESGTQVASFSIATTESWKKDGEKHEKTEWHRIIAWGNLAKICGDYLTKGKLVYIEGKLQTRKWQDREGGDRYTTEIVTFSMKMLGGRPGTGESTSGADDGYGPGYDDDVPF